MKNIFLISFLMLVLGCGNKEKNSTEKIKYYPFSLNDILDKEIEGNLNSADSAVKWLTYNNGKIEHKTIGIASVISDLKTFSEFDLNKPAWQNSFIENKSNNKTRFISKDSHLSIQYIEITGTLNEPQHVRIYFRNTNNLYESVKIIEWEIGKYYSIYSKQDVKGMEADELFVKTYY